jgi:hypothetical protein
MALKMPKHEISASYNGVAEHRCCGMWRCVIGYVVPSNSASISKMKQWLDPEDSSKCRELLVYDTVSCPT